MTDQDEAGRIPFLLGWLPGRDVVGAIGEKVTTHFPAGIERRWAQIGWVALLLVLGYVILRASTSTTGSM